VTEGRAHFLVEPWSLTEVGLDLASLAVNESVFALANGHIGMRGSLDEGEPVVVPGTYLNGFFEERPLPYAEAGYGFPEQGQAVVNVTDGKLIRLLVGDSPLDLQYGDVISHRRTLDLRNGVLRRTSEWRSPSGRQVRVTSTRLVSLTRRSIAAIEYSVECTDDQGDLYIAVQSDLLANEAAPTAQSGDPRVASAMHRPLQSEQQAEDGRRDGPRGRHPGLGHRGPGDLPGPGPLHPGRAAAGRLEAAVGEVPGLRLVQPAVRGRAPGPGRGRAGHRQAGRVGPAGARAA
jgi:alpha,alpha-trehalose phosphorylase